jgi:hypothetical protein
MDYEGINFGLLESTWYSHLMEGLQKIVKKEITFADVPVDIRTGHVQHTSLEQSLLL